MLSANEAAIRLYRRAGFLETGEVPDMFRLDGQRFSYLSMSLPLPSGAKPDAFSPCS